MSPKMGGIRTAPFRFDCLVDITHHLVGKEREPFCHRRNAILGFLT